MTNKYDLSQYLDDLESRIDDREETDLFGAWRKFALGEHGGDGVFAPKRSRLRPPAVEWPTILANDAIHDLDLMLLRQLKKTSDMLTSGCGQIMAIRADYGTPIIPSIFGAEIFWMDRDSDTLPASLPINIDKLRALLGSGVPELKVSLAGKALEAGAYYKERLSAHPAVGRHVHVYSPDAQGPMDTCEMMRGSAIFEDVLDDPAFVHELLDLITRTYIAFVHEWDKIWPIRIDGMHVEWGYLHRGAVMLRDDSAMNFSGAMYRDFIMPYDQAILDEFGGGAIHFCGRGDQYIDAVTSMRGVTGINMSQPHLNYLEKIFRATIDRGIVLIGFPAEHKQLLVETGRSLRGRVHIN